MAYRHPKRPLPLAGVYSTEDINQNFLEIADEFGRFNEHNFDANAFTDMDQLEDNAVWRVTSVRIANAINGDGGLNEANGEQLDREPGWHTSEDFTIDFTHTTGQIWVIWSGWVKAANPGGFVFAIALDGVPIVESTVGGIEWENERTSDDTGGTSTILSISTPALWRIAIPVACDALIPVTPGRHTVGLAYLPNEAARNVTDFLGNGELILIQMVNG